MGRELAARKSPRLGQSTDLPPRVVMEILGHSQIAVTMNVYGRVVQDTQREAVSHMGRMLIGGPAISDRPC